MAQPEMSKVEWRTRIREWRRGWSAEQQAAWSRALGERLHTSELLRQARSVFCYVSVAGEPDTRELIGGWVRAGKVVLVPRWGRDGMQAVRIASLTECEIKKGSMGIPVPVGDGAEVKVSGEVDVVVVPGLAFTLHGERLGQGGGYYDRWLAHHPQVVTVALAFDEQVVAELPTEAHDQRVEFLVTPTRWVECSRNMAADEHE